MDIKVLGPGCANCHKLEARTREALAALGRGDPIDEVTDPSAIVGYGVMRTPALVVDGTVVVSGRVPKVDELTRLLAG